MQFLGVSSHWFVTPGRASRLTDSDSTAGSLNFVQTDLAGMQTLPDLEAAPWSESEGLAVRCRKDFYERY